MLQEKKMDPGLHRGDAQGLFFAWIRSSAGVPGKQAQPATAAGFFYASRGVPHLPRRAKTALCQMLPLRRRAGLPAARCSLAEACASILLPFFVWVVSIPRINTERHPVAERGPVCRVRGTVNYNPPSKIVSSSRFFCRKDLRPLDSGLRRNDAQCVLLFLCLAGFFLCLAGRFVFATTR
ncbi:hypothetical protein MNBD_ALPHA12-1637 [hydrothermal vent metagenome]|uniref:Uncharacterized protein n=1 Tax=hydrothermal vent metagenome TaxID=652676 RepID=A0A3B0U616_9ZZZZ